VRTSRGYAVPGLVLALAGLLASSGVAAAPIDVLSHCAATASPTASGVEALKTTCPELSGALEALGLDETLYGDWQRKLTPGALRDVVQLMGYYSGSKWHAPDTSVLPGILNSLKDPQASTGGSWWQSLKTRLKQWLAQSDSSLASWLNRMLDRWSTHVDLSVTLLRTIAYALTVLVAIAAIIVIVRELRAAGIGRSARQAARANPAAADASETQFDLSPASLPGTDRLAALLRALVNRLLQTGRLKAERSLTHRELIARSAFESDEQRAAFAGVACGAEWNFYGPRGAAKSWDEVERRGQALLAQLSDSKNTL
jgi:hypothetical protein